METALAYFQIPQEEKLGGSTKGFRFTDRDLNILQYVLEMKFSTLEEIHEAFFKHTRDGHISSSFIWARQRIYNLLQVKMLETVDHIASKQIYVATEKGYFFLQNSRSTKQYCKPLADIDIRTFSHDLLVQKLRYALENKFQTTEWHSERVLSETQNIRTRLPKEFRPDAIYRNQHGDWVAFELEIARKSHRRYDEKIKFYIDLIQAPSDREKLFTKVHYVCEHPTIAKLLVDKTNLYQEFFKVESTSQILKGIN
ncbi:MAG: replication-relaxation family protein [Pseudobdellovibrionaceae bacterium]